MSEQAWSKAIVLVPGCKNEEMHTLHPVGYLQHYAWAAEMAKAFRQERCPGCGQWAIWVTKEPAE